MEAIAIKPDYIYNNQQHQSYTMDDWYKHNDDNDEGWNGDDDGDWGVEYDGFVSCFNCVVTANLQCIVPINVKKSIGNNIN